MRHGLVCAVLGSLLTIVACDRGASQPPEQFAQQVAAAVAQGDWAAYRPLALARAAALASGSNPTASKGTFSNLVGSEEDRIRADFERAVAARPLYARDLAQCRAIVDSTEPDRWNLHVENSTGAGPRLYMTLQRYDDSYRVVHLYVR